MKQSLMRFDVESLWYRPRLGLLAGALLPFSWLFGMVTAIRRACYRYHIFPSKRLPVPVIVVGNITVGGTGKTPCVIALAKHLTETGYHPGIVSRGVGGKRHREPLIVSHDTSVVDAGDEAVLLARQANCPVVTGADRAAAAAALLAKFPDCDVIISDDGLQHYRLVRDIEIAVIDGSRYFGNDRLLPAGPLRESRRRLNDVDYVIGNNGNFEHANAYQMEIQARDWVSLTNHHPLTDIHKVHAVAGIGNPRKFFQYLRQRGCHVIEHVFPDHYQFQAHDFHFNDDLPVVMTEKDAVKCEKFADSRMWYVPISAVLDDRFLDSLKTQLQGEISEKYSKA
jgi:tetraacyldisaccharide 4'-kinase